MGTMTLCIHRKRLVANLTTALGKRFDAKMETAMFYSDAPVPAAAAHLSNEIAEVRRHQRKRPVPPMDGTCVCAGGCCPVDCTLNVWSAWSACSATCGGGGTQSRSRTKRQPESCGGTCSGPLMESQACGSSCCPQDCAFSAWGQWSACSAMCGLGQRTRSRTESPASCGGTGCVGALSEGEPCSGPAMRCPVDCAVSAWTAWSACSLTCGVGARSRSRSVTTQGADGGMSCPILDESESCSLSACVAATTSSTYRSIASTRDVPVVATSKAVTRVQVTDEPEVSTTQGSGITLPPAGSASFVSDSTSTSMRGPAAATATDESAVNNAMANQAARVDDVESSTGGVTDLTWPIVGACVGLVVLLLLVALVVFLARRKKSAAHTEDPVAPLPEAAPESSMGTTMYPTNSTASSSMSPVYQATPSPPKHQPMVGNYQATPRSSEVQSVGSVYSPLDLRQQQQTDYTNMQMGGKQVVGEDVGSDHCRMHY
jgi:hypothetical protein